jgi:hypothetical protein
MAFGWSAGDIIAAINLVVTVAKALRESGGASSEYRLLIEDFSSFREILEILRDLRSTPANQNHVNAIRGMALTCQQPLLEFLKKVEDNYGSSLARGSNRHRFDPRQLGRKAQWGVLVPEEVAKMRVIIMGKIMSIGLRIGILNKYDGMVHPLPQVLTVTSQSQRNIVETRINCRGLEPDVLLDHQGT